MGIFATEFAGIETEDDGEVRARRAATPAEMRNET